MIAADPEWKTNGTLSAGKGATVQEFVATVGRHRLVIDVAPWGEGHLRIDDQEVACVTGAASRYDAFVCLKEIADTRLRELPAEEPADPSRSPPLRQQPLG